MVYVHPEAILESDSVGAGTRLWAFSHILPGAVVGEDCNICDHVFVENDVVIGNRVTVKSGVQLWDGVRLEDDVFVGPNATFTNDRFPRSKQYPEEFPVTLIRQGASIGGGAVILPGVEIGRGAMIGAGSVVTKSVPANAIVKGNPGRITGYVTSEPKQKPVPLAQSVLEEGSPLRHRVKLVEDLRGSLAAVEFAEQLPFVPARFFTVFNVPSTDVRGAHAHRKCEQFLMCVRGSVRCIVDDGVTSQEFLLDRADKGLHMPAMTWGTQYQYSKDAVLLVFASLPYDNDDYIRDYEEFLAVVATQD